LRLVRALHGSGPDRAEIAAREAINSPLLDGVSIRGARNVLVNISAGDNLGMRETTLATKIIQQEAGDDAEIILGTVLDSSFDDELRVTVISTGFDIQGENAKAKLSTGIGRSRNEQPALGQLPKADDITRAASHATSQFYKGENNLKQLDQPAVQRRNIRHMNSPQESDPSADQVELRREGTSNYGHQGDQERERIDKRNSDQPAFLRRIMD
jgi:Cell division GTPase